jgi:hypothetical protein
MTIQQVAVGNVGNFLVPAAGQTHCVGIQGAPFTAQTYTADWRQFQLDNFPFQPQGMYVDNTASTSPTIITVMPLGITMTVPPGAFWAVHYPAPNGQQTLISAPASVGTDVCNVWFVDYPVIPFQISATEATGSQDVTVTNWTYTGNVPVQGTALATGNVPYRDQEYVPVAASMYGSLTGSTTSFTLTPAIANQNLRRLDLSISGDAYNSASSELAITAVLNGTQIFKRTIALPSAAPTVLNGAYSIADLDFGMIGLNAAAGALIVTISGALTAGVLEANAYFTPQ